MIRKPRSRKRSTVQPPRYFGPASVTPALNITWNRVLADSTSGSTINDPFIRSTSIVLVTLESVGSQTAQVSLDGPPITGSVNVLFGGQDSPPYLHYAVFNH